MFTRFWLAIVNTRRARQNNLDLEKDWTQSFRVNLFEEATVEIVGACESRNTQKRCSSDKPVYGVGVSVYWLVFMVFLLFMDWGLQERADGFIEEAGIT